MIKHVVMWILRTRRTRVFQLVCLKTFLIFFVLLYSLDKLSQRWSRMSRTFEIDRLHDTFTMDGRPFRFISGSFHYFRAPQSKWRSIMRSMRAAGLTALSTYIEWSSHEVIPRQYRYEGHRDFEYFFQLAAEEGLYVLLRPGPFICGERDFGGLPAWLLSVAPDIVLRRNDPKYQFYVTRWFQQLFPKLQKHLYGNGGPIILVQVENEYGSDENCDPEHAIWLRDLLRSYVKDNAVLYSTDGAFEDFLACTVDGVYATVDFTAFQNTNASFQAQRFVERRGPLVNSEFYTGWLTHWQDPFVETVPTEDVINSLREMLDLGANINMYMFYGGTNFGFTSGANYNEKKGYEPSLTSYDYDSPLNEAGDPTDKYFAIRNLLGNYVELPQLPLPRETSKGDYGKVLLNPQDSIFELTSKISSVYSEHPMSFESLSQSTGFVLYDTIIPDIACESCLLDVPKLHDFAYVFLDEQLVAQLYRIAQTNSSLTVEPNQKLSIFVENMGRINQGEIHDFKGILSQVTLQGQVLTDWMMYKFPLDKIFFNTSVQRSERTKSAMCPRFFLGTFEIDHAQILDTFLDMRRWSKGVVFINGHNLGRYWSEKGPQYSLFVPSDFLRLGLNKIVVFELFNAPENRMVQFSTKPIFNYDTLQ
uniref:Beta-galactosidase n=1 Tax=Cacopsylla melanoneura TaxID=428564 RepID=A0A8D8YX67_9HEMI